MEFISQFWDTISNTTVWWVSLSVMAVLYGIIAILFFIRDRSVKEGLRSFLDLAMGILNGVVIWQALILFYNLNWTSAIKGGVHWFLRIFGENSHLGYYAMAIVTTVLFLLIWEYIFIPIFLRAGSNFSVKIIAGGFMTIYGLWLIADAVDFSKGLMSIVSLCLCGFIAFIALLRLLGYINSHRCPNCHTTYNIKHVSNGYQGQTSKTSDYSRTEHSIKEGINEISDIEETEKGTRTTTYNVYSTDHYCQSCGYAWDTEKKIRAGESETPTSKETKTTTINWH